MVFKWPLLVVRDMASGVNGGTRDGAGQNAVERTFDAGIDFVPTFMPLTLSLLPRFLAR